MYDENVAQYDEQQLVADNLARLRRSISASHGEVGSKVVYPSGYTPPSVERAKAHARYLKAANQYRHTEQQRHRQHRIAGK